MTAQERPRATGLWIVGGGGLARETLDAALACRLEVAGFLDDQRAGQRLRELPVRRLGEAPAGAPFVMGLASPGARRRAASDLAERSLRPVTLVHPSAQIAPVSDLGEGCVVLFGAYVSSSVAIGPYTHLHYSATLGHDVACGAYVTVHPGANVAGNVTLQDGVTVGSNAVVLPDRTLGAGSYIGAGAVVTKDVPEGVTVAGVPARPMG